MFKLLISACALVAATQASVISYTGDIISSDGPLPVARFYAAPSGRPVYTHTPQITENRKTQKTVHSKYNVPVLAPVTRRKVVQDVTHQYVAKPYAVPRPYAVPHPVAVPYSVPVYHHEVEYQEPLQVVRHHKHRQQVQHFNLVKKADVFHHTHQVPVISQFAARPAAVIPVAAPAAVVQV